jgi:hypothetical protein
MKLMVQHKFVEGLPKATRLKMKFYESYAFGKQHKEPFPIDGASQAIDVLGLVHSDI